MMSAKDFQSLESGMSEQLHRPAFERAALVLRFFRQQGVRLFQSNSPSLNAASVCRR
jgi:hypothetical protein